MSDPGRKLPPGCGGSRRSREMLSLATTQKKGGKAAAAAAAHKTPRRETGPPPVVKQQQQQQVAKRDAGEADLLSSMQSTPKKQRPSSRAPPLGVLRVPPAPSVSLGAGLPMARLKDTTCTQLTGNYTASHSQRQQLREQHQEAEQRRWAGYGSGAKYGRGGLSRLPAGMLNLGNTCYLNAVLQVLLSLPCFVADVKQGRQRLEAAQQPLSPTGVYSALLDCIAAKDSLSWGRTYITPASLKRALDASSAAFQGAFQQDAHELFCSLLDQVQSEVLAREVARLGRRQVRISETADPAARNFSFAVQHELTCSKCGHASSVLEEYMHLSLELPEAQVGSTAVSSINALLKEYFKEEEVEKSCEGCGGANLPHSLRHTIKRLPRVLVLHMKRFKVSWNAEQQQPVCQKLHTQIDMPEVVRLGSYLAAAALPPLAVGQQQQEEAGKENQQRQANVEHGQAAAAGAAEAEAAYGEAVVPARPLKELPPRSGLNFYGSSGGSGHTPVAAHALLSPLREVQHTPTFLRRRQGTPAAFKGASALAEDEDAQLQQALALSLPEEQPGQQRQQQQSPEAAAAVAGRQRQAADAEECPPTVQFIRSASPRSTATAELLPPQLEAAAQSSAGPKQQAAAAGGGVSYQLQDQWFMGFGKAAGAGAAAGGVAGKQAGSHKTAAEREEEELQRAIELSMLDQKQQQQQRPASAGEGDVLPGGSGLAALGAAASGAAAAEEDAELQRALQLSLLDQGGSSGRASVLAVGAAAGAAAGAASPRAAAGQEGKQSQQQPHRYASLFREVLEEPVSGYPEPAAAPAPEAGEAAVAAAATLAAGAGAGVGAWPAAAGSAAAAAPTDAAAAPMEVVYLVAEEVPAAAAAGGQGAAEQGIPQALPYLHAEIVEDDAPLEGPADGTAAKAVAAAAGKEAGSGSSCAGSGEGGGACGGGGGTKKPLAQYRLHAVINHQGPAASCGHFTADICDAGSGVWHRLNDSVTSRISALEASSSTKQRECYLLFYTCCQV